MAARVSWMVAGMRSMTNSRAGWLWRKDWPKSPLRVPLKKRQYCTIIGSLKPISWRNWATCSGVASMGINRAAGSPVKWRMIKTTSEMPTRTKMEWKSRFKMYPFMTPLQEPKGFFLSA